MDAPRIITDEQRRQNAEANANNASFSAVTPEMCFGPKMSSALATRIYKMNYLRYHELKMQWELSQLPLKPDSFYDA